MAHAHKPDFVFRRNGRVHLNRWGRQFSRLLAAEVCASALVMLGTPRSEVVWEYWLPTPFAIFPFTSPPVRHRVPSGFKRTLPRSRSSCHNKRKAQYSILRPAMLTRNSQRQEETHHKLTRTGLQASKYIKSQVSHVHTKREATNWCLRWSLKLRKIRVRIPKEINLI